RQYGGGAASCERHDDPHSTRGIGLSPRGPRHGGHRGGGAGQAQELTTNELHRVLLRARIVGVRMLAAPAKKERRFIESAMPADGTSAARCAHGDLGTSR